MTQTEMVDAVKAIESIVMLRGRQQMLGHIILEVVQALKNGWSLEHFAEWLAAEQQTLLTNAYAQLGGSPPPAA